MKNQELQPESLIICDLKVIYSTEIAPALDIGNLVIRRGERIAVIGSSGAGKTTLLRTISGNIKPSCGKICLNQIRNLKGRVGFIYQNFNMIDRVSVYENVLFGRLGKTGILRSIFGNFSDMDREIAIAAIEEVNLMKKLHTRTDLLSGGELQRTAIARVIAQEADIILADEPVSNLDPGLSHEILNLMNEISKNHNKTLIVNLHQPALATSYSDRILGLRGGRIVFDNTSSNLTKSSLRDIYDNEFDS